LFLSQILRRVRGPARSARAALDGCRSVRRFHRVSRISAARAVRPGDAIAAPTPQQSPPRGGWGGLMASTASRQEGARPNDVDVIIRSWNRPDDVVAAVASALQQAGVSRRVLIVDQGSDPNNFARVQQFVDGKPDVVLHRLEKNVGVAG